MEQLSLSKTRDGNGLLLSLCRCITGQLFDGNVGLKDYVRKLPSEVNCLALHLEFPTIGQNVPADLNKKMYKDWRRLLKTSVSDLKSMTPDEREEFRQNFEKQYRQLQNSNSLLQSRLFLMGERSHGRYDTMLQKPIDSDVTGVIDDLSIERYGTDIEIQRNLIDLMLRAAELPKTKSEQDRDLLFRQVATILEERILIIYQMKLRDDNVPFNEDFVSLSLTDLSHAYRRFQTKETDNPRYLNFSYDQARLFILALRVFFPKLPTKNSVDFVRDLAELLSVLRTNARGVAHNEKITLEELREAVQGNTKVEPLVNALAIAMKEPQFKSLRILQSAIRSNLNPKEAYTF